MAYVKYRDVPYQRDVLLSADRLDYIEDGLADAASGSEGIDIGDVDGLQAAIDGKAATTHTHTVSQVTGLQAILTDLEDRLAALEGA